MSHTACNDAKIAIEQDILEFTRNEIMKLSEIQCFRDVFDGIKFDILVTYLQETHSIKMEYTSGDEINVSILKKRILTL
jgi:hypothetical protein